MRDGGTSSGEPFTPPRRSFHSHRPRERASLVPTPPGEGEEKTTIAFTSIVHRENDAQSQRSQTPLLYRRRSGVGFSDPESSLWRVFVQGRTGASRWCRDRRLRA